jgi:hypothetical protein
VVPDHCGSDQKLRLRGRREFADLWREAGYRYRAWLLLLFLGILSAGPAGIAGAMELSHQSPGMFGWIALIIWGVGVVLVVLANYMRFREIRRYRLRTGTLDFNPYVNGGPGS